MKKINGGRDIPHGPAVKNPPTNRGRGFDSWPGRIPLAMEQLNRCASTAEAVPYSPGAMTTEPLA